MVVMVAVGLAVAVGCGCDKLWMVVVDFVVMVFF